MKIIAKTTEQFDIPYHFVDYSAWPFILSLALLGFSLSLVCWLAGYSLSFWTFIPYLLLSLVALQWWRDVIYESKSGSHTLKVQRGLKVGFILFIVSEVALFGSFFGTYFYSLLNPAIELGAWPPVGIQTVDSLSIPFLGSCVLLASGFILTLGHHAIISNTKILALVSLALTILLGFSFLYLQYNEWLFVEFTLADSIFGSILFLTTGLHALHVFIGALFLFVIFLRLFFDQITTEHHLILDLAVL